MALELNKVFVEKQQTETSFEKALFLSEKMINYLKAYCLLSFSLTLFKKSLKEA